MFRLLGMAWAGVLLVGCSGVIQQSQSSAKIAKIDNVATQQARIIVKKLGGSDGSVAPGDDLKVNFSDNPRIDQSVHVNSKGAIYLRSIGAVMVNGKSVLDVQKELNHLYVEEYRIRFQDVLGIKFDAYPQLNEKVTVRPDGRISLPMIGSMMARGKSPSELRQELSMEYSKYLRAPSIVVIVRKVAPRQLFIGGEVVKPGFFPYHARVTALSAIIEAGGKKVTGDMTKVAIIRKARNGKATVIVRNLKSDRVGSSAHRGAIYHAAINDVELQPYDVVIVPKTTIAVVNEYLDQYLYTLVPALKNSSFDFIYSINVPALR